MWGVSKPEPARLCLRAGEGEEKYQCSPRIRRDLKGQRLLVITGYFWQFDVSSMHLGAEKMELREGMDSGQEAL